MTETIRCGHCKVTKPSDEFTPSQRKNGAWCRDCFVIWHRERAGPPPDARPCEHCGTMIERPDKHSQRFCPDTDCKSTFYRHAVLRARPARHCTGPECHNFLAPLGRRSKHCSDSCQIRAGNARVTPEHRRRLRMLRERGMSEAEYDALLVTQDGHCAICSVTEPGTHHGFWQIDHDHSCCPDENKRCGRCNRGLLCQAHNFGIGQFDDDPGLLREAADYLERYQSRRKSETASTSVS